MGYLGPSWAHLGPILGLSWADLALSWGYFTSTLLPADLSQEFYKLVFRQCEMLVFGILLPWLFPEPLLEPPWRHLGPSWAILGHLEAILELSWSYLGPYCAHLGPILGPPAAVLAEFTQNLPGQFLAQRKICWGKFCVTQNLRWQISQNAKFAMANLYATQICWGKFA